MNSISFFKALLMKELDQNKSFSKLEIPEDVKKAYELWNNPDFTPGKLYRFKSGLQDPKNILNNFAWKLQDSGLITVSELGHPYVDAVKWLEANNEKLNEKDLPGNQEKIAGAAEPKDKITAADFAALRAKNEGEDHEVSMAHNSLESIIKSAMELKAKLGDDEKDIPAWIQDHITNAENYINQASKNYHEYHNGGEDMDGLPVGSEEEPVDDMTLQGMMEGLFTKKKITKEDASDWEPGFEWMDELPTKYGNWTIDVAEDSIGFDDQPIVWYYKGDENGYKVVYTPNDYYSTVITLYKPGQDMYDFETKGIQLDSREFGEELDNFSFKKYIKYGAKAIAKAEQMIQQDQAK